MPPVRAVRSVARPVLLLAIALLVATPALAQRLERSVQVDGMRRSYIAHIPEDPAPGSGPLPVIFAFHPGYGTAEGYEAGLALHLEEAASGFVVVYPDGYRRSWNAGDCCGPARLARLDEVAFVEAIFDDLAALVPQGIAERNFAMGFSNGAGMSQELACRLPGRIAAIAIAGGTRDMSEGCDLSQPVSVLAMHGLDDAYSPYDGGTGAIKRAGPRPAVEPNIAFWAGAAGCGDAEQQTDYAGLSCRAYAGCGDTAEVIFCPIPDMGHWWPGAAPRRADAEALFGRARPDLDGTGAALRFFAENLE